MPELLRIKTEDFLFTVKTASITNQRQVLEKTLKNKSGRIEPQLIKLMPAIDLIDPPRVFVDGLCSLLNHEHFASKRHEIELLTPIFFENTQYQFEWIFLQHIEKAQLSHRSHRIYESFIFSPSEDGLNARLIGTVNTGNDVGWMRLPIAYEKNGKTILQHIAFEILPTKMALHQDLPAMYQTIDRIFPLWRFSLVEKTEQDAAKGKQRGHFPLMWLANFGQVRERFEHGLKVISQAPHSRLQPHVVYTQATRLKGRMPPKLGAKVKEDFANGQYDKHYRVEKKQLSVDTPENRFIKMVVSHSKRQLADFEQRLRANNHAPDKQRLSDSFLNELHHWQQPLQKMLGQSFLKDVGTFSGLNSESLVLQQKTGYSAVYQVWQELKFYLDVFADQSSISMKSVAEIYEIWCFLCLKQILEKLGFESTKNNVELEENDFFEYQFKDGLKGAFTFVRCDGIKARLAHEPIFGKKTKPIRSYLVNQVPDIVLEVTLPATQTAPTEKRFIWLFDAKYRIKTDTKYGEGKNIDNTDFVPDDAINQMHRYRDALIHLTQDREDHADNHYSESMKKSRPVFGAFALYPGFFDQENTPNPYHEAINEIGIGAFALLPSANENKSGHIWLLDFLQTQIGGKPTQEAEYCIDNMSEHLYIQEAARIPYYGMQQVLYPDLTMTVALGGQKDRDDAYFNGFEQSSAQWYHLPKKTFLTKFKQHVVNEIRYLALASTSEQDTTTKQIDKLWPIKKVVLLPRFAITAQQAGKTSSSDEPYYLFELGLPLALQHAITRVPHRPIKHSMKLTILSKLEHVQVFSDIEQVYKEALV